MNGVKLSLEDATIKFSDYTNSTTAGTSHRTNSSKTVTGIGSSFSGIAAADENKFHYSDGVLAEVATITDNTNLELFADYNGPTQDPNGSDYDLAYTLFSTTSMGSSIENMTITHSISIPDNCIELQGLYCAIRNVRFKNLNELSTFISTPKDNTEISVLCEISNCKFEGGWISIYPKNCDLININKCYFYGAASKAVELNNVSRFISFYECVFSGCNYGINFASRSEYCNIINCKFFFINSRAVNLSSLFGGILQLTFTNNLIYKCATGSYTLVLKAKEIIMTNNTFEESNSFIDGDDSANIIISNNLFKNWWSRPIQMSAFDTETEWIISGNHFIGEVAGAVNENGVQIEGDHFIVTDNVFINIETAALQLKGDYNIAANNKFKNCSDTPCCEVSGDYNNLNNNNFKDCKDSITISGNGNICTSNIVNDDTAKGLQVSGDQNIISCNRVEGSTGNNIEITAAGDKNVVTSNITLNSGGANFTNTGTNTSLGNNIIA